MERLNRGEVWDSMKGIEPISEIQTADGKITSTYPDGSVAVFSINNGFENSLQGFSMTPQEVSECNYIGGHYASYWKNCKATWSYGLATYTLRFNYTYDQGGWRIMDYWEPLYRTYNGTVSNTNVVRYSYTLVTYYADYSSANGGSYRVKNDLKVHKASAWTENG